MHTIILVLILLAIAVVIKESNSQTQVISNWEHTFDRLQFSPKKFYSLAEDAINNRQLKGISLSRIAQVQTHILSQRREYLRVTYGHFVFDICAAHIGSGSYVSWWISEKPGLITRYLRSNPHLKELAEEHTYYEADAQHAYKDIIHSCVLEAIDTLTNPKGIRLSEFDRRVNETKAN